MNYSDLNINQKINAKGWNDLKSRYFGLRHKKAIPIRAYIEDYIGLYHVTYNQYYTCMGESKSFTGWSKSPKINPNI